MVRPARRPVGVREHGPVGPGEPHVAERELGLAQRAEQRRQLLRMPAVVLVGERHVAGRRRGEAERAGEVPVRAEPRRGAGQVKPGVGAGVPLEGGERLRARAVVGDQADPVPVSLRAQRVELAFEQLGAWLVGGHADRDRFRACRWSARRRRRRRGGDRGEGEGRRLAPGPARAEAELDAPGERRDCDDAPEDRPVAAAQPGALRAESRRRHPPRHRLDRDPAGGQLQAGDLPCVVGDRAVDEQRSGSRGELGGRRAAQPGRESALGGHRFFPARGGLASGRHRARQRKPSLYIGACWHGWTAPG